MDKDDVRERLNQHLKRKLHPVASSGPSNPKQMSPESVIISHNPNGFTTQIFQGQLHPTPSVTPHAPHPPQTNTQSKKSPRKAVVTPRTSRRQATTTTNNYNNEGSSASNSTHTTPSGTPVSRSMTATPVGSSCGDPHPLSADGPDTAGPFPQTTTGNDKTDRISDKHQDILTSVLTKKRLSMFHDPEVLDFLNSIMQSLGTK